MNKAGTIKEKIVTGNCSYINIKDDYIYYLATDYIKGKPCNVVYRANLDGSNIDVILETGEDIYDIDAIQITGDWLYYSGWESYYFGQENRKIGCLARVNIHTKKHETLTSLWIKNFQLEGEWIYFTCSEPGYTGLYKIKQNGTEFQTIYDKPRSGLGCFVVNDGFIYFSIYGELRRMDIYGQNDTLIKKDGYFMYINVYYEWIYYIIPNHLVRVRLDGTNEETLISDLVLSSISVSNDQIYFSKGGMLYQIDITGKNKKRVVDKPINSFLMDVDGSIIYNAEKTNETYKIKDGVRTLIQNDIFIPFYFWKSAYENNSIYYSKGALTKYDTLTRKETQLSEAVAEELVLTNQYIVYSDDYGIKNIFMINKNGDGNKLLIDKVDTEFMVYENWLYYGRDKVLYKLNIDTGKIIKLQEGDFNIIYADQNGVYVIENYTTYLVKSLDNSMIEVIDDYIHIFDTNEKNIFYSYDYGGNGIYLMNNFKEKENCCLISDDRIDDARIHDDIIYYMTDELCSMNPDGTNIEVIDATMPVKLTVFSDVPAGYIHENAIRWAYDNAISIGYGDKFGPEDSLTEAQFVTMLARYGKVPYNHIHEGTHYADIFYKALEVYNLPLEGDTDLLAKDEPINRGRIAQIIAAMYGFQYSVDESIMFMYKNNFSNGMSVTQKTIETYGKEYDLTRAAAAAFMQKMSQVTQVVDLKGRIISVKERNIIGIMNEQ